MTQEALKLALEYIQAVPDDRYNAEHIDRDALITAIKEALAQTQEPWCMKMNGCKTKCEDCPDEPPQRTWVDLTDEEVFGLFGRFTAMTGKSWLDLYRMTEAKLKEKNT